MDVRVTFRLLDLFCGAGGAAMGYSRAGFTEIVGVDMEPQPDYPFEFWQMDALDMTDVIDLEHFDLIHASPPCQDYTAMSNRWGSKHPRLIGAVREAIRSRPYVIENVSGARSEMVAPVELTGEMFGLRVHRPRLFELGGWTCLVPARPPRQLEPVAVYGKPDGRRLFDRADGSTLTAWSSLAAGQEALGVPWISSWHQVREAIPPAHTRFIGEQFISQQTRAHPAASEREWLEGLREEPV